MNDTRFAALFVAVLFYGALSSPTPDQPGWVEIVVGGLLVYAASPVCWFLSLRRGLKGPVQQLALLLLVFALVPLGIAVMRGHPETSVIRDILPFLFFLLPLFLHHVFEERPHYTKWLIAAMLLLGIFFSVRSLLDVTGLLSIWFESYSAEPTYFANAPSVLFAALFLIFGAGYKIVFARGVRDFVVVAVFFLLATLPVLAMALSLQRASFGLMALCAVLLTGVVVWKYPARLYRLLLLFLPLAIFLLPFAQEIWTLLSQKTQSVGLNMRAEEWSAVWGNIEGNALYIFFGMGWGAEFSSPAVGGLHVNFTHGLASSMLLKTGVVGMVLSLLYVAMIGREGIRVIRFRPILFLALACPIFIDTFLYASFKSLDFGLVLLLLAVMGRGSHVQKVA